MGRVSKQRGSGNTVDTNSKGRPKDLDSKILVDRLTQKERLEEELRQNPRDTSGWLVYADILEGLGDERGELIVAQELGKIHALHPDKIKKLAKVMREIYDLGARIPIIPLAWRGCFLARVCVRDTHFGNLFQSDYAEFLGKEGFVFNTIEDFFLATVGDNLRPPVDQEKYPAYLQEVKTFLRKLLANHEPELRKRGLDPNNYPFVWEKAAEKGFYGIEYSEGLDSAIIEGDIQTVRDHIWDGDHAVDLHWLYAGAGPPVGPSQDIILEGEGWATEFVFMSHLQLAVRLNQLHMVEMLATHNLRALDSPSREQEYHRNVDNSWVLMHAKRKVLDEAIHQCNLNKPNSFEIVQFLVNFGADVNEPSFDWYLDTSFPLTKAIKYSSSHREDMVKLLLENGAGVGKRDGRERKTALMHACSLPGRRRCVELLLEHGADVNAWDEIGRTALMFAAMQGYVDVIELLVENGAHLDFEDDSGTRKTAADYAGLYGHADVRDLLVERYNAKENLMWRRITSP